MNDGTPLSVNRMTKTIGGLLAILVVIVGVSAGLVTDRSNAFRSIEFNSNSVQSLTQQIASQEARLRVIEQSTHGIEIDVTWIRASLENSRTPP